MTRLRNSWLALSVIALLAIFLGTDCRSSHKKNQEKAKDDTRVEEKKTTATPAKPGEGLNQVRYIIGEEPITDLDIDNMRKNLIRTNRTKGNPNDEAVNELIRRALVENEARAESILVTDQKIENEVNRSKDNAGIKDDATFRRTVEAETGMPYHLWLENMRYDLIKQQIIQIKLTIPQPSQDEIKKYYAQNAARAGLEVRYREIILQPSGPGFAEETRISNLAGSIAERSRGNRAAFAELAKTTPENVSPLKLYGGFQDYVSLSEIAVTDRATAAILSGMYPGQVSTAFRDGLGRYVLLQMEDRRPVSLEKVEDRIRQRLFFDKAEKVFEEWIEKRRKETAIVKLD